MAKRIGILLVCCLLLFGLVYKIGLAWSWSAVSELDASEAYLSQEFQDSALHTIWLLIGGISALATLVTHFVELQAPKPLDWAWRIPILVGSAVIAILFGYHTIAPGAIALLTTAAVVPTAISFTLVLGMGLAYLLATVAVVIAANTMLLVLPRAFALIARTIHKTD